MLDASVSSCITQLTTKQLSTTELRTVSRGLAARVPTRIGFDPGRFLKSQILRALPQRNAPRGDCG